MNGTVDEDGWDNSVWEVGPPDGVRVLTKGSALWDEVDDCADGTLACVSGEALTYVVGGRGIAYLTVIAFNAIDGDSTINTIGHVVVHPDHQRRGIATALVREAKRRNPGVRDIYAPSAEGWAWFQAIQPLLNQ